MVPKVLWGAFRPTHWMVTALEVLAKPQSQGGLQQQQGGLRCSPAALNCIHDLSFRWMVRLVGWGG